MWLVRRENSRYATKPTGFAVGPSSINTPCVPGSDDIRQVKLQRFCDSGTSLSPTEVRPYPAADRKHG